MKTIPLTKGLAALVDDEDFDFINQWKWYASFNGRCYYARTKDWTCDSKKWVYMHRILTGNPVGFVDHKNGNTLDNRMENLRMCSKMQNAANAKIRSDNKTGNKGVGFVKGTGRWRATIQSDGRFKHLGYFDTKEQAISAYDCAARERFGEFALTNSDLATKSKPNPDYVDAPFEAVMWTPQAGFQVVKDWKFTP